MTNKFFQTVNQTIGGTLNQTMIKQMIQGLLERLDLVTREEFDIQAKVLQKTRAQLAELNQRVEVLEQQLNSKKTGDSDKSEQ